MFDMLLNEKEREKLLAQISAALGAALNEVLTRRLPDIEASVERVLIKHGIVPGTLDDIIKATVAELQTGSVPNKCSTMIRSLDGSSLTSCQLYEGHTGEHLPE